MGVGRDVCLPEILEIVVVGGRPASFDLGDDAATWRKAVDEVRACLGHEATLRGQHDLFAEPQLLSSRTATCFWMVPLIAPYTWIAAIASRVSSMCPAKRRAISSTRRARQRIPAG